MGCCAAWSPPVASRLLGGDRGAVREHHPGPATAGRSTQCADSDLPYPAVGGTDLVRGQGGRAGGGLVCAALVRERAGDVRWVAVAALRLARPRVPARRSRR